MTNKGFFNVLNNHYKGKPNQFIPAYSSSVLPPNPFCTYQIKSTNSDYLKLDERTVEGDWIIEEVTVKNTETLIIKCYHKTDSEAQQLRKEVMDLIQFQLREEIRYNGYGLLSDPVPFNIQHEKTDTGFIYCYMFTIELDYSYSTERRIPVLKIIELKNDIKDIVIK